MISTVALVLILTGAGLSITFYVDLLDSQPVKIAALAQHADIKLNTMETFAQSLSMKLPKDEKSPPMASCPNLPSNWVAKENQKPGVNMTMTDWHHLDIANPQGSVLWLDQISVTCGQRVGIHASTHLSYLAVNGRRTFEALRIGWYAGSGARLVWKSQPIKLKEQRIPIVRSAERMVETRWKTTLQFTVGKDWTPGFLFDCFGLTTRRY